MTLTETEAQALWFITSTSGFTSDIADALKIGGLPTMGVLLSLKDKGLAENSYNLDSKCYQWRLTPVGLAEHERRMDAARQRSTSGQA